jgi:hypothetical protein
MTTELDGSLLDEADGVSFDVGGPGCGVCGFVGVVVSDFPPAVCGAGVVGGEFDPDGDFLLALAAFVPFWYTAITIFIWDRDLGFRQNTFTYRVVVWGIWPVFGVR